MRSNSPSAKSWCQLQIVQRISYPHQQSSQEDHGKQIGVGVVGEGQTLWFPMGMRGMKQKVNIVRFFCGFTEMLWLFAYQR
jgi:tellurite resistance protein TehA-like permease